MKVTSTEGQFLSLTELQFVYDNTMAIRLAIYKLLAEQKYRLNAFVTVIFFLPPPAGEDILNAYHKEFMGQIAHIDFQTIKIWELDAEVVLRYDNPMLLPFIPLMRGGATEHILRRCAQRIRQEPAVEAIELEAVLAIFAGYVMDVAAIRAILRWEMQIIQESPILQELKETWIQELKETWVEEGREEGREATLAILRSFIAFRFNVAEGYFDQMFAKFELSELMQLKNLFFSANSLDELEQALENLTQTHQNGNAMPAGK